MELIALSGFMFGSFFGFFVFLYCLFEEKNLMLAFFMWFVSIILGVIGAIALALAAALFLIFLVLFFII